MCKYSSKFYHHDKKDPEEVDEEEDLPDAEEGPGDGDGQDRGPDGGDRTPEHPHCYQQALIKFELKDFVENKNRFSKQFLFTINFDVRNRLQY